MAWNLPDDVTDEMVDRAAGGYDDPEPEDPENEYPLVPCHKCLDYPCRCLEDEMEAELAVDDDAPF